VALSSSQNLFLQVAATALMAYFAASMGVAVVNLGLHGAIDSTYREWIVDRKVEKLAARTRELERKYKAKIEGPGTDLEGLRVAELANYAPEAIMMAPLKALPGHLVLSLLIALIIYQARRLGRSRDDEP
jgi:hypothetical protein